MRNLFISLFLLSLLGSMVGCGSTDLALINQVKRFEPEWTRLADKVSYIDRNLRSTHRHYQADFEAVNPYLTNTRLMSQYRMPSMRSQFLNVISQRDSIQTRFTEGKEKFLTELHAFNEWENQLMRGRVGKNEAYQQFSAYKEKVAIMQEDMGVLQDMLISNIEEHNSILRQLSGALDLYQNFDINPR
jgi:hypothetical protein